MTDPRHGNPQPWQQYQPYQAEGATQPQPVFPPPYGQPASGLPPHQPPAKRSNRFRLLGAAALVGVLAIGGGLFWQQQHAGPDLKKCEQLMRDAVATGKAGAKADIGNADVCKGLTEKQFADISGRVIWSGLGGDPSELDQPTAAPTPDEAGYLDAIHTDLADTDYAYVGDDTLTSLGQSICDAIDRGTTRPEMATVFDGSVDAAEFSPILAAATTYLCPEHADF